MRVPGGFDSGGNISDILQTEPNVLDPGLAVAFAAEKTTLFRDQAQHFVESRCRFGSRLLARDLSRLPLFELEQQGGLEIWPGRRATAIIDLANTGIRPTRSNRMSTNPASRNSAPSVRIDQNLM